MVNFNNGGSEMKKIEEILNDESVMTFSNYLFDKDFIGGSFEEESAIQKLIDEKLQTNHMNGICTHDDGYLCEHRKEYFIRALKTYFNVVESL